MTERLTRVDPEMIDYEIRVEDADTFDAHGELPMATANRSPPPMQREAVPLLSVGEMMRTDIPLVQSTDDLAAVVAFYRDGLGFDLLYEFRDHDGFDGVMLGRVGAAYHLEFTRKAGHAAGRAPTEENLLVFYLPDESAWRAAMRLGTTWRGTTILARTGALTTWSASAAWMSLSESGSTSQNASVKSKGV